MSFITDPAALLNFTSCLIIALGAFIRLYNLKAVIGAPPPRQADFVENVAATIPHQTL